MTPSTDAGVPPPERSAPWSAWRAVAGLGVVSLAGDIVYEGARSITGPFLASLGATALVVGLVTGAGEAMALVLRLLSGPLADRTQRYWAFTITGYAMTAVSVPLMAVSPFLGGSGLAVACALVLAERTGKAVRSPSKTALLAYAAKAVGRGRGFAVHKALDQVGAFAGPLLVAGVIALTAATWAGLAVLAVPGAVAIAVLLFVRAKVPDMSVYDPEGAASVRAAGTIAEPTVLPRRFYLFATASAASTFGLMTFGIISFHLVDADLVTPALVPVIYALAMLTGAGAALATGFAYDRWSTKVLLLLPFLVATVPVLALADRLWLAVVGVAVWGGAAGVQESTVKALVADLVPARRLATAYGVFAAFEGVAALLGGGLAGALYSGGRQDLVTVIAVMQAASLILLVAVLRAQRR